MIAGVPQSSILSPLLFSIFWYDIFSFLKDANLSSYTDNSTLYAYMKFIETIIYNLRQEFPILSHCFYDNYMVLKPRKYHFILFSVKKWPIWPDVQLDYTNTAAAKNKSTINFPLMYILLIPAEQLTTNSTLSVT